MIAKTMFITDIASKLRADKKMATFEELALQLSDSGFTDHTGKPFVNPEDAANLVNVVYDRLQLQGRTAESEYVKQAFM